MSDKEILARRFTCDEDRRPTKKQHTVPCRGCPWRRDSLKGYLGSNTPEEWIRIAHSDQCVDCHNTTNQQCVGAAMFRANVCKSPRDPEALRAKPSRAIFAGNVEFLLHHNT